MYLIDVLLTALGQALASLLHNWPLLLVSILVGAAMKLYVDKDTVAGFLRRHEKGGVLAATAAAVGTPLCSCGTTAIVLGMMAGSMPWAPIIAFMVASPLTSPEELFYSAGLFGWPFAIAFFAASIVLGLAGGLVGTALDARGWLRNQARFVDPQPASACEAVEAPSALAAAVPITLSMPALETCGFAGASTGGWDYFMDGEPTPATGCSCGTPKAPVFVVTPEPCGCDAMPGQTSAPLSAQATNESRRFAWMPFLREVASTGRRLLVLFLAFATIGFLINDLIPSAWITALFGSGHAYGVPLAATLGLPFYINTEASLPLVRGMLDSGMSSGAALAFLITGAGTSIGAVGGALTIARWRVLAVVIGTLWVGAILCGLVFDGLLAAAAL